MTWLLFNGSEGVTYENLGASSRDPHSDEEESNGRVAELLSMSMLATIVIASLKK